MINVAEMFTLFAFCLDPNIFNMLSMHPCYENFKKLATTRDKTIIAIYRLFCRLAWLFLRFL